nr:putative ribonuclease H-like domain-containing protein [Tanacetum cinerariifolium]
ECQTMVLNHDSLSPAIQRQANVPQANRTVTTSNELDLLFSPMFDELLNGSSKVVSKSSAVSAADAPNQRQQPTTPLNNLTTPAPTYAEMCMFALTVSRTEPKNIKEAMADSTESMQDELHQFDRLDVWELVDRPYFAAEGIQHQTSVARTPEQNGVVERRNRTLVEAARTMLSTAKVPLFFWAEAIATACFTQNPVSKSSAVSAADAPNQRQQYTTPLNNHTTPTPTCQIPTIAPTVISSENINQAKTHDENDQVADDEFINISSTPVQDQGETSSRHVDSSNMHTFYQRYPSE